jgi:TM2 domain-containing membrane protein YozV
MTPEIRKKAWSAGIIALLFPGAGHFYLGQRKKAFFFGGIILFFFFIGIILEGEMGLPTVDYTDTETFNIVPILVWISELGMGILGWLFSLLGTLKTFNSAFAGAVDKPVYEIATTYLLVAGVLNYQVAFHAFDQAVLITAGKIKSPEVPQ